MNANKEKIKLLENIKNERNELNNKTQQIKQIHTITDVSANIKMDSIQQVNIIEPNWNPVRVEQVIRRAIRTKK